MNLIVQGVVMQCGTFELWSPAPPPPLQPAPPSHTSHRPPVSLSTNSSGCHGALCDTERFLENKTEGGGWSKLTEGRAEGRADWHSDMKWKWNKGHVNSSSSKAHPPPPYPPEALCFSVPLLFYICVRLVKNWEFLWSEILFWSSCFCCFFWGFF